MRTARAGRRLTIVAAFGALVACAVPGATADAPAARTAGPVALGVLGDATRFQVQTGQRSTIRHTIISWNQGVEWGTRLPVLLAQLGPVPLLGLGTSDWRTKRQVVTPRDIAQGKGDGFLIALNAAIAAFGELVYVRPLPEMNNHHRPFSAFDQSGRSRGASHSTAAFRRAFARIAVLARGGPAAEMNAKLRRLGLPPVAGDLPPANARVVWNPQGYGSPDIPAELRAGLLPGGRLRRRRRQRPLRPALQRRLGRERAPLCGAPEQALRDRRVGSLGGRRPGVRRADGRVRQVAPSRRVRRVLHRSGGIALGSRDEAPQPCGVSAADHSPRLNDSTAATVASTCSSV